MRSSDQPTLSRVVDTGTIISEFPTFNNTYQYISLSLSYLRIVDNVNIVHSLV